MKGLAGVKNARKAGNGWKHALAALLLALLVLTAGASSAESLEEGVTALPLDGLQKSADESESALDVRSLILSLVSGETLSGNDTFMESLKARVKAALNAALPSLLSLTAPAILWALSRQMAGGTLASSADMVCYLAEAGALATLFSRRMESARLVTGRLIRLIERFHPLAAFVLVSAGKTSSAALMRPAGALATSLLGGALMQTAFALSACMAALAVIGNLSERLTTDGLFKLCKRAACWLLGCASTLFLGLMKADSLLESGRDALAFRAAEYAVDKLLPVIGKDVSDTLGTIASGTAVIRSAVGVTGTAVMLALCLEPALALICDMLVCRLAAALSEPVAAGPLTRCLKGFADALMILLLAQVSADALFLILAGMALRGV